MASQGAGGVGHRRIAVCLPEPACGVHPFPEHVAYTPADIHLNGYSHPIHPNPIVLLHTDDHAYAQLHTHAQTYPYPADVLEYAGKSRTSQPVQRALAPAYGIRRLSSSLLR